jgi:GTP-binding protein Era
VPNERHKQIILGIKGEKIKQIGTKSRQSITELLGKKIHLFLFVKVRAEWQNSGEYYEYMGLSLR